MFRDKIIIAGSGGQGALRVGQMLAYTALNEGWEVEWLPSYGAEMRGGTANCNVTISDEEILFPMIEEADCCVIMNDLSLERFENKIKSDGIIILDNSMIHVKVGRSDLQAYYVPANTIAEEEGNTRGANMVLLGAYIAVANKIPLESIYRVIENSFTGSKAKYASVNKRLVKRGYDFIAEYNQ